MGRRMNENRSLTIKDKEEPKGGEECNNWNEKYTGRNQQ